MTARAEWFFDSIGLLTAACGRADARRFMLVERLPDGGWDWVAWCGDRGSVALHGLAVTAAVAMVQAERAAASLGKDRHAAAAPHRPLQLVPGCSM